MGHLSIHCDYCGTNWAVYNRDDKKDWKARTCPVCGKSINEGLWENHVLRAFGEMEDASLELYKEHTQSHEVLFAVSYIPDVVFPNADKGRNELKEEIENLREVVETMTIGGNNGKTTKNRRCK